MLLEHLGSKITLWTGAVQCDPWWHKQGLLAPCPWMAVFIFPYLSAISECCDSRFCDTPPPPVWTPAASFICSTHRNGSNINWCWPEGNHTFVAPKLCWNKIHTSSVAASPRCCGLVLVLLSFYLPRILPVLLVPKQVGVEIARSPAFLHTSLPSQGHFFFFFFPPGSTDLSFLVLISHHFPLIWLSFLHIIYSHRCL